MKLAKCAALAATITGALAASCGVVYGYCAVEWSESVKNLDKCQNIDELMREVAWRFDSFLDYLLKTPIHYFALIGLILLILFAILFLYHSVLERIEWDLIQKLNCEKKNKLHCTGHVNEIEQDLKHLFKRFDSLSKDSPLRSLYNQRINALLNELKEANFQLQCIESSIRNIKKKLQDIHYKL